MIYHVSAMHLSELNIIGHQVNVKLQIANENVTNTQWISFYGRVSRPLQPVLKQQQSAFDHDSSIIKIHQN
jgi:hypothetical protein